MLSLDSHAHIDPKIESAELVALDACVIAMSRSLEESDVVAQRVDPSVVWGIGCHPGLARAVNAFSEERFRELLERSPVVGEVGLDGSSRVPLEKQRETLSVVFGVVVEVPRIVSVHSYKATAEVLELLRRFRPTGVVLHWWLGTPEETAEAIELGAYFSVNAAQATKWPALAEVPSDRILAETDHPFGDRREPQPRRPGRVSVVENRLADLLRETEPGVRELSWRNFDQLVGSLGITDMLPREFQVQLLANPRR